MKKPSWWTSDDWATPQDYFDKVSARLGPFDLDPCCRPETAKAPSFLTLDDDGLAFDWFGKVWVNPPYSKPKVWCEKAAKELAAGHVERIVMLLPAAVDTHWFHDWVLPFARVEFIRGRLRFIGWEGTPIESPKSGNVLAIYEP